jgi:hypothetical protein
MTIVHLSGATKQVRFAGVFGKDFTCAYVRWPLAGEYQIAMATGQLMPKKVSIWRLCAEDMERLAATIKAARLEHAEQIKERRAGSGR